MLFFTLSCAGPSQRNRTSVSPCFQGHYEEALRYYSHNTTNPRFHKFATLIGSDVTISKTGYPISYSSLSCHFHSGIAVVLCMSTTYSQRQRTRKRHKPSVRWYSILPSIIISFWVAWNTTLEYAYKMCRTEDGEGSRTIAADNNKPIGVHFKGLFSWRSSLNDGMSGISKTIQRTK